MRLLKGLGFLLTPRRVAPPLAPTCGGGGGSGGGRGDWSGTCWHRSTNHPEEGGKKKIYVAAGEGQEVAEITFKFAASLNFFTVLDYYKPFTFYFYFLFFAKISKLQKSVHITPPLKF